MEIKHAEQHAKPAELNDHVLALAKFSDTGLPQREGFFLLGRVWTNAEWSADMVQDNCRLREGARQSRQFHQLRMVQPGLEGQIQRRQPRKSGTPGRIGHLPFR